MKCSGLIFAVLFCAMTAIWSAVALAEERHGGEHHISTAEVGVLGQISLRHLIPSLGVYGLFLRTHTFEVHASAWVNPLVLSEVGLGAGTMHQLSRHVWLGWEAAAELDHAGVLYGLGPVFDLVVLEHQLNVFLKVPVEYGHRWGWSGILGLTVAIWH